MKIKKAWLLHCNGEVARLEELEGKEMNFKTMYPIIGCSIIEHVGLGRGVDMWVDEEGLLKNDYLINRKASKIYQDAYNDKSLGIVGNAIITDNTKAGSFVIA